MLLLCSSEEGEAAPSHLLAADFAISVATPAANAFCDALWSSTAMAAHYRAYHVWNSPCLGRKPD